MLLRGRVIGIAFLALAPVAGKAQGNGSMALLDSASAGLLRVEGSTPRVAALRLVLRARFIATLGSGMVLLREDTYPGLSSTPPLIPADLLASEARVLAAALGASVRVVGVEEAFRCADPPPDRGMPPGYRECGVRSLPVVIVGRPSIDSSGVATVAVTQSWPSGGGSVATVRVERTGNVWIATRIIVMGRS
jgi:hypothetical protein